MNSLMNGSVAATNNDLHTLGRTVDKERANCKALIKKLEAAEGALDRALHAYHIELRSHYTVDKEVN